MTQLDPPSMGEIIRRLDQITARQERMLAEMKEDRADAAKLYVRQDVWLRERELQNAFVSDLRGDISEVNTKVNDDRKERAQQRKDEAAARRQIWLGIGTIATAYLIFIAGLIVNVVR